MVLPPDSHVGPKIKDRLHDAARSARAQFDLHQMTVVRDGRAIDTPGTWSKQSTQSTLSEKKVGINFHTDSRF
jgi:hypothetical protein